MGFIPGVQGCFSTRRALHVLLQICKRENKNQMILSSDAEEAFDKIRNPCPRVQTNPNASEYRDTGNVSQHLPSHLRKARGKLSFAMGKHRKPCPEEQARDWDVTLTTAILSIVRDVMASAVRQQNETKGIQTGKEEVNNSLFADDIILYLENPKDSTT